MVDVVLTEVNEATMIEYRQKLNSDTMAGGAMESKSRRFSTRLSVTTQSLIGATKENDKRPGKFGEEGFEADTGRDQSKCG